MSIIKDWVNKARWIISSVTPVEEFIYKIEKYQVN